MQTEYIQRFTRVQNTVEMAAYYEKIDHYKYFLNYVHC